jgi:4-hydroxy-tetrahydrodipicolinate reductase
MNISLIGYGKMGKEIEQLCIKKGHNIYSIVDPLLNTNLEHLRGTDLVIEFTAPTAAVKNITYCLDQNIPVVSGTTGWHNELEALRDYCRLKNGSFFYSSNFSIGVNLFWKMSKVLTQMMDPYQEYSLGLHEIHHDQKKDAPSGTAVTLAQEILTVSNRFSTWEPVDVMSVSKSDCIPISSERLGATPGTHTMEYRSAHDRIQLTHEAFSRGGFVSGVVAAAEWLIGKKGVYGMDDLFADSMQ